MSFPALETSFASAEFRARSGRLALPGTLWTSGDLLCDEWTTTMIHKAFVFEEETYRRTLYGPLYDAELDPEEADAALAALYNPDEDIGIGSELSATRAALAELFPEGVSFLAGAEVPGRPGWYTQSAQTVARNLALLEEAAGRDALHRERILRVRALFQKAVGRGLLTRHG